MGSVIDYFVASRILTSCVELVMVLEDAPSTPRFPVGLRLHDLSSIKSITKQTSYKPFPTEPCIGPRREEVEQGST